MNEQEVDTPTVFVLNCLSILSSWPRFVVLVVTIASKMELRIRSSLPAYVD
jgi:hypothetical protein